MTRKDAAALGRQSRTDARAERLQRLASMRLNPRNESPMPGYVTSQQAAWRLGVCQRTVERDRAALKTITITITEAA